MDYPELVRAAGKGDVKAFVALTRRFQRLAFGSALSLVGDVHAAEDVAQEAFLAAWLALPRLADPAAFPGWLRSIVRHHAYRVLRRPRPSLVPLADAADLPSQSPAPDQHLESGDRLSGVLAALAALPPGLREPATLYYLHECSQQDVAVFLDLPLPTVNNRLHAARSQLKQRTLAMMEDTRRPHGPSDDFANRIGRLVNARGELIEALFDPASLPDLLAELLVSDEANKRAVAVQVVQRPGGGIVRGIAAANMDGLPIGATVLNSERQTTSASRRIEFAQVTPLLATRRFEAGCRRQFVETGIKVIDVMCPLVAGGTVVIAGEPGAGLVVLMEELVRRLSKGTLPISLFLLVPPFSAKWPASIEEGFTLAGALKQEGYSEGTLGAVETFFLRGQEEPWTASALSEFSAADVVIHLSAEVAKAKLYSPIDPRTCRSRLLESGGAGASHAAVARRVRETLTALPWDDSDETDNTASPAMVARAWKLMHFFTQPFFAAERHTERKGSHVSLAEALRGCEEIIDGQHDDLPLEAFYFGGTIEEIRRRPRGNSAATAD
jgi:RNA polymerase sigma factor (sigma-70 family)